MKKKKPAAQTQTLPLPFGRSVGSVKVSGYTVKPYTRRKPRRARR